jgi:peptidoglycan/LPS O-acetylase OafA/YrhL
MPTLPAQGTEPTERWHALDAVRGVALLLGVLLHASLSDLPGAGYWYIIADADSSTVLAGMFFVVHSFRMLCFFLIAGFFARLALQRWGSAQFIHDRSKRIGVPLLAGWFPIFAAIVAVVVWAAWVKGGGSLPSESPPGPAFTPSDFPLTHLWFLYLLLLCYAGALVWRGLLSLVDRQDRCGRIADRALTVLLRGWAPLLLAPPLARALTATAGWSPWFGIPTPDTSLYPNLAAVVGFGMAFALGWGIQRRATMLLAQIQQARWTLLALAVLATVCCFAMLGIAPAYVPDQGAAELRLYALLYAIAGWAWALALVGHALQTLAGYSAWRRYLADASYWIYLMHLPLIMALQVVAAQTDAPWWLEYSLINVVAMGLLLLSYRWWVRGSWIGALLNGRRMGPLAASPRRSNDLSRSGLASAAGGQ